MKKTFLARRNSLLSSRSSSWGALSLAAVVILLFTRILAPNFFWHAFAPVFKFSDVIATETRALFNGFGDTAALVLANEKMTNDNAALVQENQMLSQKVADLTALLGGSSNRVSGILAGVVARPPMSPYDTLVIARGETEGVRLGMEAFDAGGVPVGVVSSVLDDFSRVTLFSSSGVEMAGWVGQESIPITLTGRGGGTFEATAARTAAIAEGDLVFVPGPGQLPIGTVVRVDSDPLFPGVILRITPVVNLFTVTWVELRTTGITGMRFATSTLP